MFLRSTFLPLCLALGLSGCWEARSPAGSAIASTGTVESDIRRNTSLLVATTRKAASNPSQSPWFSASRGKGLNFAQARLIPPSSSFLGTGEWAIAGIGEVATDSEAVQAFEAAALGRDVLIYVHGYRESFETAALSAAQLSDGIGFHGITALFAWPSGAATFDYAYDKESAIWSRDAFEELLQKLSESPSGGRVHIVAHSMGALLTLETLRNLKSSGGTNALGRIGAVVLASPDVDIDVFSKAVNRLGSESNKITVITATNDRALEISRRVAGGVVRVGAVDGESLRQLGVRVADASDFGSGLLRHDLFLRDADVRAVVKRAIERTARD